MSRSWLKPLWFGVVAGDAAAVPVEPQVVLADVGRTDSDTVAATVAERFAEHVVA